MVKSFTLDIWVWFRQGYAQLEAYIYIAPDFVTFEQHQLDGWSTDIAQPQPIRSYISELVSSLSAYESK